MEVTAQIKPITRMRIIKIICLASYIPTISTEGLGRSWGWNVGNLSSRRILCSLGHPVGLFASTVQLLPMPETLFLCF